MRKLIIAISLLAALLLAPLLVMRSESALIRIAHWAVDSFTDLRLELKDPVLQPFRGVASAREIHLYPKDDSGPPFLSILDFTGDLDVRDFYAASFRRTSLSAAAVTIYVSDRDNTSDPAPLEWLQYLRWLPQRLEIDGVHLVTTSENTFIFPLEGVEGQRTEGDSFTAAARAQYEGEPLDFELGLSAIRDQVKFTGLDLTGRFIAPNSGSEVRLDGELRGTIEDFNYDFKLVGNYTDIGEFMRGFRSYNELQGVLQVQARMRGNTRGFKLDDAHFLLNNLPAYGVEAVGSMSYDIEGGSEIHLVTSGELASMEAMVDWIDIDLRPLGRAQGRATVTGTLQRPVIDEFILRSESASGLLVNVKGHLEPGAQSLSTNRIAVDIHGPELAVLAPWTGPLPYEIGAFSASGTLTGLREEIRLAALVVELGREDQLRARIEGSAENIAVTEGSGLTSIRGLDLSLALSSPDTANIASTFDLPLPAGFEVDSAIRLQGNGDQLDIVGGELAIVSSDIVATLSPTGGSLDLGAVKPLSGLMADVALDMSDTSALSQFVPGAVPALGPVKATASLVQHPDHLSLDTLTIVIDGEDVHLQALGRVGNVQTLADTRLDNTFTGVEPRDILFTLIDDFTYPKSLGELDGQFTLDNDRGKWNISGLAVATRREGEPLELVIKGDIQDLAGSPSINLDIRHILRDPAFMEALTGLRMNPSRGQMGIRSSPGQTSIAGRLLVGETEIESTGNIRYKDSALEALQLAFYSPQLYLGDLGLQAASEQDSRYNPAEKLENVEPEARFRKLLRQSPRFPTDIAVKIDGIVGENTNIESLDLHVTGVDNRYTLRQFSVGYENTIGELRGIIDLNTTPPSVSVAGHAIAIPLNTLGRDLGRDTDIKGRLTVRGGLASTGYSTEELLKDLDGNLALALEDAEIEGAAYDVLATDLLAWIYSGAAREKSTHIDCTMARFDMLDGVARSDSLYIETKKMVATGSAKFDMVREEMDVTITPRSKSRQFQVPSSVRLKGSFDNPRPIISPVAAAADAYAEFITLVPRMVIRMFGGNRERKKSRRPCEARN